MNVLQLGKRRWNVGLSMGSPPGSPTGYGSQVDLVLQAVRQACPDCQIYVFAWHVGMNRNPQGPLPPPHIVMTTEELMRHDKKAARNWREQPGMLRLVQDIKWIPRPFHTWPHPVLSTWLADAITALDLDMIIGFQDMFIFETGPKPCLAMAWEPLHFMPLEHQTICALSGFDAVISISGYGNKLLENTFGPASGRPKELAYIPHGRCSRTFAPLEGALDASEAGKAAFRIARDAVRRDLGWPLDAQVILIVAANSEASNRKAFDAQLQAVQQLLRVRDADQKLCAQAGLGRCPITGKPMPAYPLHTYIVIHSNVLGEMDLGRILEVIGEFPQRANFVDWLNPKQRAATGIIKGDALRGPRFEISGEGRFSRFKNADMAAMMQAADVLLGASTAEGFGVPILEAQLCGTPAVTNGTTAMAELTRLGETVLPNQWIMRNDFNSGWMLPRPTATARALQRVLAWTHAELAALRNEKLPELRRHYSPTTVKQSWVEAIRALMPRARALRWFVKQDRVPLQDVRIGVKPVHTTDAVLEEDFDPEVAEDVRMMLQGGKLRQARVESAVAAARAARARIEMLVHTSKLKALQQKLQQHLQYGDLLRHAQSLLQTGGSAV